MELIGGIRPDLGPWIGDLVVEPKYQKQGIGKMLVDVTIEKAKVLGFEKLYLFAFDPTILEYYVAVLQASPEGYPLYKKLGYKACGAFREFKLPVN